MHVQYPSSVHGAYMSGVEQAQRIVRAMDALEDDTSTCSVECYGDADIAPIPST